jgi:hypothetical protein
MEATKYPQTAKAKSNKVRTNDSKPKISIGVIDIVQASIFA